jgi:hypothetical protein
MQAAFPSTLESNLRLFFGFLLWAVSATLTFVLLISLGDGSTLSKVLLGVVAISLEGSKILAWRKSGPSRIYAFALIFLSGIASLGTSLQVIEKAKGSFLSITQDEVRSSPAYLAEEVELASIDTEISALVSRLKVLPPDYTTAAARTESSLAALRDRKQGILDSLATGGEPEGVSHVNGSMIALLSRTIGLRPEFLLLVLLLFVSASIEVGALLLTVPGREDTQVVGTSARPTSLPAAPRSMPSGGKLLPSSSHIPPITPETFLEAAKEGSDLPFLYGRDTTAEKLGISYAEAKRLVGKLIEDGRVVVEGKRLRLAQVKDNATPARMTS